MRMKVRPLQASATHGNPPGFRKTINKVGYFSNSRPSIYIELGRTSSLFRSSKATPATDLRVFISAAYIFFVSSFTHSLRTILSICWMECPSHILLGQYTSEEVLKWLLMFLITICMYREQLCRIF